MNAFLSRFTASLQKGLSAAAKFSAKSLSTTLPMPLGVLLILLLVVSGLSIYGVKRNPELIGLLKGPADIAREEREFIAEVNRGITLPKDEKPTIATVTDPEKLAGQPFFQNAKKGDKILMFSNAKKAILYRPDERRVIEVGAVNISQGTQVNGAEATPSGTQMPEATIKETPKPTPTPMLKKSDEE